jgi:hypothetical protein
MVGLFPLSHLEHGASVKRFVSFQFLNVKHSVGLHGRVMSPSQGCYLTQTQNKHKQTSMPWVGFEPTIPASERAKTVHALGRAATVIGLSKITPRYFTWLTKGIFRQFNVRWASWGLSLIILVWCPRYISLWQGPRRKHLFQHFLCCCARTRRHGNLFVSRSLPSNGSTCYSV